MIDLTIWLFGLWKWFGIARKTLELQDTIKQSLKRQVEKHFRMGDKNSERNVDSGVLALEASKKNQGLIQNWAIQVLLWQRIWVLFNHVLRT